MLLLDLRISALVNVSQLLLLQDEFCGVHENPAKGERENRSCKKSSCPKKQKRYTVI